MHQTLQIVSDSLHILDRASHYEFFVLLDKCWNNYPLGKGMHAKANMLFAHSADI